MSVNIRPEDLHDNEDENGESSSESTDSDSLSIASNQEYDSSRETALPSVKDIPSSAEFFRLFFFSSLEGDFSWAVAKQSPTEYFLI